MSSIETSAEVAAIAARLLNHNDPDVRKVAASCLAQREVETETKLKDATAAVHLLAKTRPEAIPQAVSALRKRLETGATPGWPDQLAYLFRWLRGEED